MDADPLSRAMSAPAPARQPQDAPPSASRGHRRGRGDDTFLLTLAAPPASIRPMGPLDLLLLAVGLAMDATAVAASCGLAARGPLRPADVARVAVLFGGFQAVMPLLGWLAGHRLGPLLEDWDHWVAFGLLTAIGGKMAWEGLRGGGEAGEAPPDSASFRWRVLLPLALATSIDALAVGLAFPLMDAPVGPAVGVIGVVTAALSAAGVYAGRRFGARLGARLDVAGGLVLFFIGLRILLQHVT